LQFAIFVTVETNMTDMTEKKAYSVTEASEILNVSGAVLRKYINAGKMQAVHYFGKWIIPSSEIERYKAKLAEIGLEAKDLD